MRHRNIFKLDRTDPFATGLDHVLAAIRDLQKAVTVEMRNVAGREPAILQRVVVMTEIAIDHPVAAYQQIASRCAVARQFTADVINRLQIDRKSKRLNSSH